MASNKYLSLSSLFPRILLQCASGVGCYWPPIRPWLRTFGVLVLLCVFRFVFYSFWTFIGLRHLSHLFSLVDFYWLLPFVLAGACSSCASAHHHNCKRCASRFVFASVHTLNCVALLTLSPLGWACGSLLSSWLLRRPVTWGFFS